jgi:hypothetical protein
MSGERSGWLPASDGQFLLGCVRYTGSVGFFVPCALMFSKSGECAASRYLAGMSEFAVEMKSVSV